MKKPSRFGPALLVTAAFIGPGSVLVASKSGAAFGFTLLWAVAFAVIAVIVLQEMAARLGIVSGQGLSDAIKYSIENTALRWSALTLVLGAILVGNMAYQTGNIVGGAAGFDILTGLGQTTCSVLIAFIALVAIWIGRLDVLQYGLIALVVLMSLFFIIATVTSNPPASDIVSGFVPSFPVNSGLVIIGLIGTTVVPYNLFLHASTAAEKWKDSEDVPTAIRYSRWDTFISVAIGGVITAAILITAAVAFHGSDVEFKKVSDVADQLKPALGAAAKTLFAIGLTAAGLTSAITAPIAAGYASAGCFGWPAKLADWRLKTVATIVVVFGLGFAIYGGSSPVETLILAQVANGLLLPIVVIFLIYVVNRAQILKQFTNGWITNILSVAVLLVTIAIAINNLYGVWGKIQKYLEG